MRHDLNEALAWFTAQLTGVEDPARSAAVAVYVTGVGQWRDFDDWPPADSGVESWYLQAARGLSRFRPLEPGADSYRYDPADPTPARGGVGQVRNFGAVDQRRLEARPDVLVYTSTALTEDLAIAGPVTADLFVHSSRDHFDLFVCLCDVSPGGVSVNLSSGIQRLTAAKPVGSSVTVELWPRAHVFRRGHRLRLQISSGAHPHVARNLGTGAPLDAATEMVTSHQVVSHGPGRLSRISLTVLGSRSCRRGAATAGHDRTLPQNARRPVLDGEQGPASRPLPGRFAAYDQQRPGTDQRRGCSCGHRREARRRTSPHLAGRQMVNPADRHTALIAVDLMERLVRQQCSPHPGADVVRRTVRLADTVRASGGLVVWVRTERPAVTAQPPGSALAAGIAPAATDFVVVKRAWGAFHTTDLHQRLRRRSVSTLWIAGIATNLGVESTARCADELGYRLVLVEDAMSALTTGAHRHCIESILVQLGEVITHADVWSP